MNSAPRLLKSLLARTALASAAVLASLGTIAGPASAATPAKPSAPTGIHATYVAGATFVVISWNTPTSNYPATSLYTVLSTPGSKTCTSTGATSCTISNLTYGTSYTFKVDAKNSVGTSTYSGASNAITYTGGAPSAPTGVVAAYTPGASSATISWTPGKAGADPVTKYTVSSNTGGLTCTSTTTSCVITGMSDSVSYTFTVTETTAVATSPASAASNPITYSGPVSPSSPYNVVASYSAGAPSVTVYWSPSTQANPAVTKYTVTSSPGGYTCTTTTTTCNVAGETDGVSYTFTVTATNSVGTSAASAASNAVVYSGPEAPSAPNNVVASYTPGAASVMVYWTPPTTNTPAATSYKVTSSTGGFTCTSTTTSCMVSNLGYGVTYTFTVTATNSVGTGAASKASNAITYTGPSAPSAPNSVVASYTPGTASVMIYWTPPTTNSPATTHYTVTATPGGYTCTSTTTSCTISDLTDNVSYTFTVKATNAIGTGAASKASNAIIYSGPSVPDAPTNVTASFAPNSGTATIYWTASPVANPVVGIYRVTATPGGAYCLSVSTTCTIPGLRGGVSYTFSVKAINANGPSLPSKASNAIMSIYAPNAPTGLKITSLSNAAKTATLSWKPSITNGSPVISYTVYFGKTVVCQTAATSCTMTGFVPGPKYYFAVVAQSPVGFSPFSATLGPVTPTLSVLSAPATMTPGEKIYSTNGAYFFELSTAGNLVIVGPHNHIVWILHTHGGSSLALQRGGDLVVRNRANHVLWQSHTHFVRPGRLAVTNTGIVVWLAGSIVAWHA